MGRIHASAIIAPMANSCAARILLVGYFPSQPMGQPLALYDSIPTGIRLAGPQPTVTALVGELV
jgi:hypothetical protein